ncbi:microfibril-associated glycoprotein 4-like isoform X2 [Mytilus edulis]|uniref:microfibril-associated glycoprotein 4-like isoform X2 n=1 Tax=Mytilus edulis TaxID=6550 RepID=UPI0039EF5E3E
MAETQFSISTVSSNPSDNSLHRSSDFINVSGHDGHEDNEIANRDRNHQDRKDRKKASTCTILMFVLLTLMSLGQIVIMMIQFLHISKEQESMKNITQTNTNHIQKIETEADQSKDTIDYLRSIQNREAKECSEIVSDVDGVYFIYPVNLNTRVRVYCIMENRKKKWTVLQRRSNETVSFDRSWNDYRDGFGSAYGEYWLEQSGYANYSQFSISDENSKYMLRISGYSGSAGDAFNHNAAIQNGQKFTTKDQDNDNFYSGNCAVQFEGGWWFNACHNAFLNGDSGNNGRKWYPWADKVTYSVMMIRQTI